MSHRIDTAVKAMQTAPANARQHSVITQTGQPKLMDRHDPMLPGGHLRHPQIPSVTLLGHIPIKVTRGLDSPPGGSICPLLRESSEAADAEDEAGDLDRSVVQRGDRFEHA